MIYFKNISILLILLSIGCHETEAPNLSDVSISLNIMKDVNPNLIDRINHDIALCYKPQKWETNIDTMYLAKCENGRFCWKTNIGPIQDVHDWVLSEFKNISNDTIILLGATNGQIFSSFYFFNNKYKLVLDHPIFIDDRLRKENLPCPIKLAPQQSYFVFDREGPHPLSKSESMVQFMYYKRATDSIYKYWLTFPEKEISDYTLMLFNKYEEKISKENYNNYLETLTLHYLSTSQISYRDSLVKLWIND